MTSLAKLVMIGTVLVVDIEIDVDTVVDMSVGTFGLELVLELVLVVFVEFAVVVGKEHSQKEMVERMLKRFGLEKPKPSLYLAAE